MHVRAIRTRVFKSGEDLVTFIVAHVPRPDEDSVIVVTSKIVALSEKRIIENYKPSMRAKIIKRESEFALKTKYAWLTIKDGTVMASAGTDESNANGTLILLPLDSYAAAHRLRKELRKKWNLRRLGVLITDRHTTASRWSGWCCARLRWFQGHSRLSRHKRSIWTSTQNESYRCSG